MTGHLKRFMPHRDGNCVFEIYFLFPLVRQEHWAATCLCKRPVAFRLAGEHWVIMGGSCFLVSSRSCSMDKRSGKSEGMEIPNSSSKKRNCYFFSATPVQYSRRSLKSNSLWEGYPDVSDEYLCELSKMAFVPGNCPEFIFEISEIAFSSKRSNHCIDCISFSCSWTVASPPAAPCQIKSKRGTFT